MTIDNITRGGTQLKFDVKDSTGDTIIEDLTADIISSDPDFDESITPVWIWADPVIFDDETKRVFLDLPQAERPRFTVELLEKFYSARPEYNEFARKTIYNNPLELLELFKSLTPDDFAALKIGNADIRYKQMQQLIERAEQAIEVRPIDPDKLASIWPILSIREPFLESELAAFYYLKNPRLSPKERAKMQGAIMTTGGRLADISNKNYSRWLDEAPNKYAYISYTGDRHFLEAFNTDENGEIQNYNQLRRAISDQDKKARRSFRRGEFIDERPEEHERINKEVLQALLRVANTPENRGKRYLTIYVPSFAREFSIHYKANLDDYDERGELTEEAIKRRSEEAKAAEENKEYIAPNFLDLINDLNYWVGVLNDIPRQMVNITSVDYKNNTIDIDLPYINYIIEAIKEDEQAKAEREGRTYLNPAYDYLFHTSVTRCKDPRARDLATTIVNHILTRGSRNDAGADPEDGETKKEKIITIGVKYSTLIDETPALKMAYTQATPKRKYTILDRTFKRAFKVLNEDTDLFEYYIDLNIPQTPPTTRTVDDILLITHKGINPNYKIPK